MIFITTQLCVFFFVFFFVFFLFFLANELATGSFKKRQ